MSYKSNRAREQASTRYEKYTGKTKLFVEAYSSLALSGDIEVKNTINFYVLCLYVDDNVYPIPRHCQMLTETTHCAKGWFDFVVQHYQSLWLKSLLARKV